MNTVKTNFKTRLVLAWKKSGFSPNAKEGVGAGIMCALLMIFDLPMMFIVWVWNLLFGRFFEMRSIGIIAFSNVYNPEKATLGSIFGFLCIGAGIGGWFNPDTIYGFNTTITHQQAFLFVAVVLAIIDVVASLYVHFSKQQINPQVE